MQFFRKRENAMFCPNCGAMLDDNAKFCTSCGSQLAAQPVQQTYQQPQQTYQQPQQTYQQPQQTYQQPQQTYQQPQQTYQQPQQTYQQQSYQQTPYQAQTYQQTAQPVQQEMPMKWHKFLCYFGLWLGAVLNLFSGILLLVAGNGNALTKIYGIILVAIAVFDVYVAINMIKMKKGAPKKLILLYAVNLVVGLVFTLLLSSNGSSSSSFGSLAGSALMVFANLTYYKKREHLFVN